jgi:hypothetical protein
MPRYWLSALIAMTTLAAASVSQAQTVIPSANPPAPQSTEGTTGARPWPSTPIVPGTSAVSSPSLADIGLGKVAPAAPNSTPAVATTTVNSANVIAAQVLLNSSRDHEKNKDFDKAVVDLEKALLLHPTFIAAYLDLAYLHNVKRNFGKAIAVGNGVWQPR